MTTPVIGSRTLRIEDPALLRGDTTFVANLDLDGVLVAHHVCSIEAHALINSVDTSEARSMPGVVDVVTAADLATPAGPDGLVPKANLMPNPMPNTPDGTGQPVLAADRVRFVGEPIAVIVAETAAQAADAAETVVVDYEPLPAVIDPLSAGDAGPLFPEVGTNVMVTATGGVDEPPDFSGCEVVVEVEVLNNRVAPCPLETRVAASMWTDDGRLVHYAACQGVHPIQKGLAAFYQLEPSRIRVITADVGGSFGAKSRLYPEDVLLPWLARRAGRPVRWTPARSADMVGLGHSRAQHQTIKVGGRRDGTIEAIQADILGDCGAYPLVAIALMHNAGRVLPGPHDIPNVHWTGRVVVTNTTPVVAYRGAGRPEGGALLNRGIDAFAHEIGLDPLEVRRHNLLDQSQLPWENPNGLTYDSGDYRAGVDLVAGEVDHDGVRRRQQQERADGATKLTGIGWATFIDRTAGLPGNDWGSVELQADGSVRVLTSSSPYGQGHYTSWAMLVSERTGLPLDRIEVFHGDTDVVPKGGVTGGSRSTQRAGNAVAVATDQLVERARAAAGDLLEASAADIVLDVDSGTFHVAGAPGAATVDWSALAAQVVSDASSTNGDSGDDDRTLRCETDYDGEGPSVPWGAYAAVVTVDIETGQVVVERLVSADDCGTILNPMLVEGQLHGGIAQGLGQALFEEFRYDDAGNPVTANFLDYAVPSAAEMPSFEVHLLEYPSPNNLLGFKGIAESGCIGATPAIQNAVVDALAHLGVRHIDMPITPERVWRAVTAGVPAS